MLKRTKKKYLNVVEKRLGRKIKLNHLPIHEDTKILLSYIASFLSKEQIKYIEKKVAFHQHLNSDKDSEAYGLCIKLNIKGTMDYVVVLDSAFNKLSNKFKLALLAHELGHVFEGSNPKKSDKANEDAANQFVINNLINKEEFKFDI